MAEPIIALTGATGFIGKHISMNSQAPGITFASCFELQPLCQIAQAPLSAILIAQ
jgi:hypothetical protein